MLRNFREVGEGYHVDDEQYLPIDTDTAWLLTDYLDDIMSAQEIGRSAKTTDDSINEWFEQSIILSDAGPEFAYSWPLTQQKLVVRRTDTKFGIEGQVYNIILEWQVTAQDLIDPSVVRAYSLELAQDDSEQPKLLTCVLQSQFYKSIHGEQHLTPENNDSSHYEVDKLLFDSFSGRMALASQYDAEDLLSTLSLFCNNKNTR